MEAEGREVAKGGQFWVIVVVVALAIGAIAAVALGEEPLAWRPFAVAYKNHALCGKFLVVLLRGKSAKPTPEEVRGTFLADDAGLKKLRELSFFCNVPDDLPADDVAAPLVADLRKKASVEAGKTEVVIVDVDGERIEKALTEPTPEMIRDAVRVFGMYVAQEHAEGKFERRAAPKYTLAAPAGWVFADVGDDAELYAKDIDARAFVQATPCDGDLSDAETAARMRVEQAFPSLKWNVKPKYQNESGKKKKGAVGHEFAWKTADGKAFEGALRAELKDGVLTLAFASGKAGLLKQLEGQADALEKLVRAGLAKGTK